MANIIIGFLVFLGTICAILAALLVYQGRRPSRITTGDPSSDEEQSPAEIPAGELPRFRGLLDEDAPRMLQHLAHYRRLVGAAGLKSLARSYTESSEMTGRNRVLELFMKLYGIRERDQKTEDILEEVVREMERIERQGSDDVVRQLLGEIQRLSPAQTALLPLLSELFEVTEAGAKRIGVRLKKLPEREKVLPGESGIESEMGQLLGEIYELVDKLSKSLPQKQDTDKTRRREKLEPSLDFIQQWVASCSAFQDSRINSLPEAILTQHLIGKLWYKLNDFLKDSGGRSREIGNVRIMPPPVDSDDSEPFRQRKPLIALAVISAVFYVVAAAVWFVLHPNRFDVDRAIENIVQIETPKSRGTGFFINQDGLIVSNYHVVAPFTEVTVKVKDRRNRQTQPQSFTATVLVHNRDDDTAILKIISPDPVAKLPSGFQMERGAVFKTGQSVHVLGNPVGLTDIYTRGVVMKVMDKVALMDVKIGPGNSGGPVCDDRGVVLGVTTAYAKPGEGSFDFGIAVSSERVWRLIDRIQRKE